MQALWMIVAAGFFSLANLVIKLSINDSNPAQMLFFRGLFAVLCMSSWCYFKQYNVRTQHLKLHFVRGISGVSAIALYTYVLTLLPMVTAVTMNYTSPVWLALFTVFVALIKRTQQPPITLIVCIFSSMLGVILLLKPIFEEGQTTTAILGLLSGFFSAVAYWQIKSLNKTGETTTKIVFYHSIMMVLVGGLWWLLTPRALEFNAIPNLLIIGLLTMAGQLALTFAISNGSTFFASSLMYLSIVFSAILGVLFTKDGTTIDILGYVGITIIVGSSIMAAALTTKKLT
ncbi:MAG: hypothetical protein RL344_849 [Pseudomonadota bacterium]|jgi:S-adenosylmethionine uptake transporter